MSYDIPLNIILNNATQFSVGHNTVWQYCLVRLNPILCFIHYLLSYK